MKIEIFSLKGALDNVHPNDNWISIRDLYSDSKTEDRYSSLDKLFLDNGVTNVLIVNFDDIDPYRFYHGMEHYSIKKKFADGQKQPIFFNSDIARDIVDWVRKLWDKNHDMALKIHCWAGRSRSQALGYWLNIYFNLVMDRNLNDYFTNNALNIYDKVHFNCEVLKVLSQTFG